MRVLIELSKSEGYCYSRVNMRVLLEQKKYGGVIDEGY